MNAGVTLRQKGHVSRSRSERLEKKMIELDGAAGEGGGQILRTALALSLCTGQPLQIRRIRARRSKPGIMRQHLACVNAAVAIGSAKVAGAELGSQELCFEPGPVRPGEYVFNVGTAGSCSLVLQTVLPPLMLAAAPSRITLGGGTHNPMAPPFHFLDRCFAPLLRKLGVGLDLELRRLGFYPAGGGEFRATITPVARGFTPFDVVDRGGAREAYAECLAPALSPRVAERELEVLGEALQWEPAQLRTPAVRQNEGPGNALMATLAYANICELVTAFGEKGVASETVARSVIAEVESYRRAPGALGPHLADQWMLPLALAVARSGSAAIFTCTEMSDHSTTNAHVIQSFLPVRILIEQIGLGDWRVLIAIR
jgi:RNA 3'-terminal phosphate cyclase (ATP)